jgi:hypothetical protein
MDFLLVRCSIQKSRPSSKAPQSGCSSLFDNSSYLLFKAATPQESVNTSNINTAGADSLFRVRYTVIRRRQKKPSLFPARAFSFRRDKEGLWRWCLVSLQTPNFFWRRAPSRAVAQTINILRAKPTSVV